MVHMITLCTGRGHNRCIRNRGNMVTTYSTCKYCWYRDDHHFQILSAKYSHYNRNQDCKGSPGSTCRESKEQADCKHDNRNQEACGSIAAHYTAYKIAKTKSITYTFQCPGQNQHHNSRYHQFETVYKAFHKLFETYHFARQIQEHHEDNGYKCGKDQTDFCITSCKSVNDIGCSTQHTCVNHGSNCWDNKHCNRQNQVKHTAFCWNFFFGNIIKFFRTAGKQIAVLRISLVLLHFAEIKSSDCDINHHKECQNRIQVVWNCTQEQLESGDTRILRYIRVNCCSPGWNGSDNTNGSCCSVDNISKLCSWNLLLVSNRTHYGTNSQTVKIIIHKDQCTKAAGRQQSCFFALNLFACPVAVCCRAAGLLH